MIFARRFKGARKRKTIRYLFNASAQVKEIPAQHVQRARKATYGKRSRTRLSALTATTSMLYEYGTTLIAIIHSLIIAIS
jgi:hypothetical protein